MKLLEKLAISTFLITASVPVFAVDDGSKTNSIPEPGIWALFAIGAMAVYFANRKK